MVGKGRGGGDGRDVDKDGAELLHALDAVVQVDPSLCRLGPAPRESRRLASDETRWGGTIDGGGWRGRTGRTRSSTKGGLRALPS